MFTYEQIQTLNDLEMSVYNYVIQHTQDILKMKIRELADGAHVSTTTVLRFCHKMDCEGYSEFKIKLKLAIEKQKNEIQPINHLADLNLIKAFFEKVKTHEFQYKLDAGSQLVSFSQNVLFYGIGSSGILGQYGARFFSNLGIYSSFISDPFFPGPETNFEKSLLIVLSVTGETDLLINQVNWYKQKGFKIISITNSGESTLAKVSDVNVSYYMPIEILGEHYNITTQVPVIHIIETIGKRTLNYRRE